jgi:hypothetical protein
MQGDTWRIGGEERREPGGAIATAARRAQRCREVRVRAEHDHAIRLRADQATDLRGEVGGPHIEGLRLRRLDVAGCHVPVEATLCRAAELIILPKQGDAAKVQAVQRVLDI